MMGVSLFNAAYSLREKEEGEEEEIMRV